MSYQRKKLVSILTTQHSALPGGSVQGLVREFKTDMEPAEFRALGHHVVDWIADYLAHPEQ